MGPSLFQFLTPAPGAEDPNKAVANAVSAGSSVGTHKIQQQNTDESVRSNKMNEALQGSQQAMQAVRDKWGMKKDQAAAAKEYADAIAEGTDAGNARAEALAPTLKSIGVDMSPDDSPEPGKSPEAWHAEPPAHVQQQPGASDIKDPFPAKPVETPQQPTPQQAPPPSRTGAMPAPPQATAPVKAMPGDDGQAHLDESIAAKVKPGAARPLSPGEYVSNKDGSWSSEKTMTVMNPQLNGGQATNIPSMWVVNGKPYTAKNEDEAAKLAAASGLHFPTYKSIGEADAASVEREKSWQGIKDPGTEARKVKPLWDSGDQQAPTQPTGALPKIRVRIDGQDMGVIDPNQARKATQESTSRVTASAVASVPDRYKKLMEAAQNAKSPAEAKAMIATGLETIIQSLKNEAAVAIGQMKASSAGSGQVDTAYAKGQTTAQGLGERMGLSADVKLLESIPATIGKINSGNYTEQMSGLYGIARANAPGDRITDKDFANAQTRTLWEKLKDTLEGTGAFGPPTLSPGELSRMDDLLKSIQAAGETRMQRHYEGMLRGLGHVPRGEMMAGANDYMNGIFGDRPWYKGGVSGAESAAPHGGGPRESGGQSQRGLDPQTGKFPVPPAERPGRPQLGKHP